MNKKTIDTKEKIIVISGIILGLVIAILIWVLLTSPIKFKNPNSTGNFIEGENGYLFHFETKDDKEYHLMKFENMFPGDTLKESYYFKVIDERIEAISFKATYKEVDEELKNVLQITISNKENVLYSGLASNMPQNIDVRLTDKKELVEFTIEISLPTTATNECQNKKANFQFDWWVEKENYSAQNDEYITYEHEKCSPWCFGACPWCWILICGIALVGTATAVTTILYFKSKKAKK